MLLELLVGSPGFEAGTALGTAYSNAADPNTDVGTPCAVGNNHDAGNALGNADSNHFAGNAAGSTALSTAYGNDIGNAIGTAVPSTAFGNEVGSTAYSNAADSGNALGTSPVTAAGSNIDARNSLCRFN